MTIGEKDILAVVLNFLQDKDLISNDALDEAFLKLNLPQEYKDFYENNTSNFIDRSQYIPEERQNEF